MSSYKKFEFKEHPFERTECECDECKTCCRHMPGNLIPEDLEKIIPFEALADDDALADWIQTHLCASAGATVMNSVTGAIFNVPTIVPQQTPSGACIFLDDEDGKGYCTVHESAPFGCAYLDPHMTTEEADRRSHYGLDRIVEDAENYREDPRTAPYTAIWLGLNVDGIVAAPIALRKAALLAALDELKGQQS